MAHVLLSDGSECLVDNEDAERLSRLRWYPSRRDELSFSRTYAVSKTKAGLVVYMHRLVMCAGPDQAIDHLNADGLDNRRANLRFATLSMNNANRRKASGRSSRFKGVSWNRRKRLWEAYVGGRRTHRQHLGYFRNEHDAARAYDRAAVSLYGSFARLNLEVAL